MTPGLRQSELDKIQLLYAAGMIQSSSGFRFLNKSPHAIVTLRENTRKNLQRNLAIELGVFRQIHLAHPALANLRADFVAAESCA